MNSWFRALAFIRVQQRPGPQSLASRTASPFAKHHTISIPLGKSRFAAELYTPPEKDPATIIFLHGMSPLGITDPRQIKAAQALCAAGFRVICPEIADIRNLRVTAQSIETFVRLVEAILTDPALCPTGRAAMFAPSFSGAICLKAAVDPRIADSVSAVCALGAFSRIERSLHYLMHTDDADAYARLIILANFLPRLKIGKNLGRYYFAAAHDNWNATASRNKNLTGFTESHRAANELRRLSAAEQRLVKRLENDRPFRREIGERLLGVMQDTLEAYNVAEVAHNVRAPVFLLHGAKDDVIPARESTELFPLMQSARLVVSPFIGHADTAVSLKQVPDVWRLVSGFAWYFRCATA